MTIHFYLRFSTHLGQTLFVSGDIDALGNDKIEAALPLAYFDNEFWHGSVELPNKNEIENICYRYLLHTEDGDQIIEGENDRLVNINESTAKQLVLIDTWNH